MTAAVANGGDVLVPHILREVIDDEGTVIQRMAREVANRLDISERNLAIMREGLRQAAANGTARSGASSLVEIGGKTGTAEFGLPLPDGSYETHGWYTGFAPYASPEIAIVVFLENGRGAGDAGPVARQIFDYYFGRERLAEGDDAP